MLLGIVLVFLSWVFATDHACEAESSLPDLFKPCAVSLLPYAGQPWLGGAKGGISQNAQHWPHSVPTDPTIGDLHVEGRFLKPPAGLYMCPWAGMGSAMVVKSSGSPGYLLLSCSPQAEPAPTSLDVSSLFSHRVNVIKIPWRRWGPRIPAEGAVKRKPSSRCHGTAWEEMKA